MWKSCSGNETLQSRVPCPCSPRPLPVHCRQVVQTLLLLF